VTGYVRRRIQAIRGELVSNQAGKRLRCEECGAEVVVTKGGEGSVACHGQPMQPK
jgi:Desulfoferrodoxin, N-terminal domain